MDSTAVRIFEGGRIENYGLIEASGGVSGNLPRLSAGKAILATRTASIYNAGRIEGDISSILGNLHFLNSGQHIGAVDADAFDLDSGLPGSGIPNFDIYECQPGSGGSQVNPRIDGSGLRGFEQFIVRSDAPVEQGIGPLCVLTGNVDIDSTGSGTVDIIVGELRLAADAVVSATETRVYADGILSGDGRIDGNLVVEPGGILSPGASPGRLSIDSLFVEEGGAIEMEVTGSAPGEFDQLIISGEASIDNATLRIVFEDYVPVSMDDLRLLVLPSTSPTPELNVEVYGLEGQRVNVVPDGGNIRIQPSAPVPDGVIIDDSAVIDEGALVAEGVWIGPNVRVRTGSEIYERAFLEAGAQIGTYATIKKDVRIGPRAVVGDRVIIDKSTWLQQNVVVGQGTIIKKDVVICEGAQVGSNVHIRKDAQIGLGAVISSNSRIEEAAVIGTACQ